MRTTAFSSLFCKHPHASSPLCLSPLKAALQDGSRPHDPTPTTRHQRLARACDAPRSLPHLPQVHRLRHRMRSHNNPNTPSVPRYLLGSAALHKRARRKHTSFPPFPLSSRLPSSANLPCNNQVWIACMAPLNGVALLPPLSPPTSHVLVLILSVSPVHCYVAQNSDKIFVQNQKQNPNAELVKVHTDHVELLGLRPRRAEPGKDKRVMIDETVSLFNRALKASRRGSR